MPPSRVARAARVRALARLNRLVSSSLDLRAVLTAIAGSLAELMRAPVVSFWIADEAARTVTVHAFSDAALAADFPVTTLGFGQDGVGWVAQHRQPLDVGDVFVDGRFRALNWWKAHRLRAFCGVPVVLEGAQLVVLAFGGRQPFRFSAADRALLDSIVGQAAVALAHARLFAAAERRRRQAEALADVARGINGSLELGTVLQRIAESAQELCQSDLALIALRELGSEAARLRYWTGVHYEKYETVSIEPGKGSGGLVLRDGQPFRTEHWERDPRISKEYLDLVREKGVVAEMVVPIRIGARVEGLLYVQNRIGRPFGDADETIVLQLADHAAVAIQNAQLFAGERRARAEAETAERRYRLLFERNVAGVFSATRDGRFLEVNESMARILGYASREDVLARNTRAFWVDLADRDRVLARMDHGQLYSDEVRLRRQDGGEIWALVNITPVSDGASTWLEGVVLDITDRKRVEAAERAVGNLRSVTSLASAAAHEINNPLTVVMGTLDLVARRSDDATVREWLDRGREAVRRIRDIIGRMSKISRLQLAQEWPGLPPMLDIRRSSAEDPPDASER